MSRFAQARAQAGLAPLTEDNLWERETPAADALLTGRPLASPAPPPAAPPALTRAAEAPVTGCPRPIAPRPVAPPPGEPPLATRRAVRATPVPVPAASRHDLSLLVERVFLGPGRARARSVLFCSEPGDFARDTAWRAADLLATESGKRVAFVEDGSQGARPSRNPRVVWIGWYAPEATPTPHTAAPVGPVTAADPDAPLGDRISDLFASFDYVVVAATAADPHDLVALTREVDGVVLIIDAQRTRREMADQFTTTLRDAGTNLLGAVFLEATV